jgi:uncharacterized membrane protein YfcA
MLPEMVIALVFVAFLCEYIDSSLGMGYGTSLTPLLLLTGFEPLQIVPAVLLSQFAAGMVAGLFHQRFGNVNFRLPSIRKITFILTLCSTFGVLAAVLVAVNVSALVLRVYIGLLVLAVGIAILVTIRRTFRFSWLKLTFFGFLAAFNKGISGGGYGPLVTGGQILSGVNSKNAIGITTLSESLTCIVGFLIYLTVANRAELILVPPLMLGAVLSAPLSAFSVKKIQTKKLSVIIGALVTGLGVLTLLQTF